MIYTLVCHGCGRFHEVEAGFLSSPLAARLPGSDEGSEWTVPMSGCSDCQASTADPHPIRRAYDQGMTPESIARMNQEWPAVRERLTAERDRNLR